MDQKNLRAFAAKLDIALIGRAKNNGWIDARCPLAPWTHKSGRDRNPSFGLRINERGYSAFKCFSCGAHGSIPGLAFQLANYSGDNKYRKVGRKAERVELLGASETLPEWDEIERTQEAEAVHSRPDEREAFRTYPFAYGCPEAARYLRKRSIGIKTALRFNIRWDWDERRVLFPVYDEWGRFEGFTGRAISGPYGRTHPRVKDYYGLRKRKLLLGCRTRRGSQAGGKPWRQSKRVLLCEGPFDAARLESYGFFVKALLGSELTPEKADLIEDIGLPIVWFLDPDEAGMKTLYGPKLPGGGRDFEQSALNRFYGILPQFIVEYPKSKKKIDPGVLTREQAWKMYNEAELFVKESLDRGA